MNLNYLLPIYLCQFDGGEGAGAAASADGGATTGDTNGAVHGRTHRGKSSGEYTNVKFGKQMEAGTPAETTATNATDGTPAAGENTSEVKTASNTLEERRKAYRDLINGEYKDIHTEETQRIINRRFGDTKAMEKTIGEYQPLVDMLMQRYGVEGGDIAKLTAAVENDEAYLNYAAEEAGMSVEAYKEFQRMKRDNAAYLREQENRVRQQAQEKQVQEWYEQAQQLKTKFPNFDLATELQNEEFHKMLVKGNPIEHAYKVMHFDEIMSDTISTTAAEAEKRVVDNVRAKGARPAENGTSAQSAFTVKDDPSKWSKKDRAEVARRVARGEKIYL